MVFLHKTRSKIEMAGNLIRGDALCMHRAALMLRRKRRVFSVARAFAGACAVLVWLVCKETGHCLPSAPHPASHRLPSADRASPDTRLSKSRLGLASHRHRAFGGNHWSRTPHTQQRWGATRSAASTEVDSYLHDTPTGVFQATPAPVIFMRPHVFGAKGDTQDRTFVPLVIRAVLQFNPTAHVYMLHNDPALTLPDQPRFHGLLMDDYETPAIRQFKATYVHLSTNAAPYEIASTLAYFYVASLMDAMALQRVVVVETDVLVFCDLWAKLGQHWDLDAVDAILTKRRVMAASYVTRTYLETFVNVALDFYRDDAILTELRESVRKSAGSRGGITDMTVNAWLAKPAFARRNAANHTVRIDELSRLIDDAKDGAAYFDSNIRTANYSFGAFTMDIAAGLGPVKKLFKDGLGGAPRGRLNGRPVGLWGLHFQGGTKELIPAVFERFVAGREERKGLHLSRLHYYLHGHAHQTALEAAASPARAAAALGVAAASPVAGPGTADPDALRAKGRLMSLNASICAAGQANLSTEIKRQVGADSPVARQGALADYVADACAVAPPASAAYVVGDVTNCFSRPVFVKARPCGCNTSVLLNLNRGRHFGFDPVREGESCFGAKHTDLS